LERSRPSLGALVLVFLMLSLTNFGGAQSSAIYREIVRKRGWLDPDAFMEYRAIAQVAPGANSPNLAVLLGSRLYGPLGALIAHAAATVPCVVVVLVLGFLALRFDDPVVRGALAGCAAASLGSVVANAAELTVRYRGLAELAIVVAVTIAVAVFHASLALTLVVFLPVSVALAARASPKR
jgi:chromate transporter